MRRNSRVAVVVLVAGLVTLALLVTPALVGIGALDGDEPAAPTPTAEPPAASDPSGQADPGLVAVERRLPDDPLAVGVVDAPVVLVNFSDFRCSHCGRWARETKPELMPYVERGTLRIEWRDFPYLSQESVLAAVAARAAGQQGAFWEFHDALFAEQPPAFTEEAMVRLAGRLDLDVDAFEAALGDEAVLQAVRSDFDLGQSIGVNATPAFLVNDEPILGAQPTEVFVEAVEAAAAAATG